MCTAKWYSRVIAHLLPMKADKGFLASQRNHWVVTVLSQAFDRLFFCHVFDTLFFFGVVYEEKLLCIEIVMVQWFSVVRVLSYCCKINYYGERKPKFFYAGRVCLSLASSSH